MLSIPWLNKKPTNLVISRFFQSFQDHGVEKTQIPNLLPQVSLSAIASSSELLKVLTPDVLEQTAQMFGIRRQWLEGVGEQIYEGQYCYQAPERFFEHIARCNLHDFPFRILSSHKQLDRHSPEDQRLVLVVVENITRIGEQEINRYHLFAGGWRWNYEPTRIQLKALARVVHRHFPTPIPIFKIERKSLDALEAGQLIPHSLVRGGLCPDPCLEDYALCASESRVAKEVDELPQVLEYITAHKLDELARALLAKPVDHVQNDETRNHPAPEREPAMPSGKRAQADKEIWGPIEAIVQVWWATEEESLGISQAISRIKELPHLKASHFADSTIRKHIARFAPKAARKAGRRPVNSPNMQ